MTDEQNTPSETPEQPPAPPVAEAPAPAATQPGSGLAKTALILAIAAIVMAVIPFVTFASPLVILAALVFSIIALVKKAGSTGVRITSLILAVVAIPVSIVMFFVSILIIASNAGTTLNAADVEADVIASISDEYGVTLEVECPDLMVGTVGEQFECEAREPETDTEAKILVTITEDGYDWEVTE